MKIKFDPALSHQQEAIAAVVEAFSGQEAGSARANLSGGGLGMSDFGTANILSLTHKELLANVRDVQEKNGIPPIAELQGRQFSVEMETGTGKTYVYLRTIFELAQKRGLRKFIIVVPSVAIREGVLKSLEMTAGHFRALYGNTPFDSFVYDSAKLGRVRQFAVGNELQIMVINIQAFLRDNPDEDSEGAQSSRRAGNVINREHDRMSGRKPIDFISATRPVVIIDEPQKVDNTPKAQNAVARLKPIFTLRYSATHRNAYNLLYQLSPVRAYDLRLVKRIEVLPVREIGAHSGAYVRFLSVDHVKNSISAKVEFYKQDNKGELKKVFRKVRNDDNLYELSGKVEAYRNGYIVSGISRKPGNESLTLSGGFTLRLGGERGGLQDDVMRAQVRETVETHLEKEKELSALGINAKTLSLFFIDRVSNYREYDEKNNPKPGKIARWFEEEYAALTKDPAFARFAPKKKGDIEKMHNGYFSQDKKTKQWKDSSERGGGNAEDNDAYNLIMREKERLLDPDEPLRFIFSHSALREGWDNPNVFQICALNQSSTTDKKRQEVGRGLRLPVDSNGERIQDERVNRLTIVTRQHPGEFAFQLEKEMEADFGVKFGVLNKDAFVGVQKDGKPLSAEESAAVWRALVAAGHLNQKGEVQPKFAPDEEGFVLFSKADTERFGDIEAQVIDIIQRSLFRSRVVVRRKKRKLKFNKQVFASDNFKKLWEKIKWRTRYSVEYKTSDLVKKAAKIMAEMEEIKAPRIEAALMDLEMNEGGVRADAMLARRTHEVKSSQRLPNLYEHLQNETGLTRGALFDIMEKSGRIGDFLTNPILFREAATRAIRAALRDLMLSGIQYEKIAGEFWEMRRIEKDAEQSIVRYMSNLHKVSSKDKCLFDFVEFDSRVEKEFAEKLDSRRDVRFFMKLPSWFRIETPIGPYNPDWAFVKNGGERLYFVCETKSSLLPQDLRPSENQKIMCGEKHFAALDTGVKFRKATKLRDVI